jgi:hypothetical protein
LDGQKVDLKVEQQKGRWGWYTIDVQPGKHTSRIIIAQIEKENIENGAIENGARPHFPQAGSEDNGDSPHYLKENEKEYGWRGKVSVWIVFSQKPKGMEVSFDLTKKLGKKRPIPPRPWPSGALRRTVKLGQLEIRSPSK